MENLQGHPHGSPTRRKTFCVFQKTWPVVAPFDRINPGIGKRAGSLEIQRKSLGFRSMSVSRTIVKVPNTANQDLGATVDGIGLPDVFAPARVISLHRSHIDLGNRSNGSDCL